VRVEPIRLSACLSISCWRNSKDLLICTENKLSGRLGKLLHKNLF